MDDLRDTKPAKIEDVAKAAGVSIMSVSRALRGVDGVSEQTRARIVAAAAELGYAPNRLAGSLAQATSNLVCISVPTLFDAVFAEIITGMRDTLAHAGLETILETSDYDQSKEAAWVERMAEWSPAALVLSGVDHSPDIRNRLAQPSMPVMEIWDVTHDPIDLNVGIDHRAVGAEMGQHLADLGYRRPAYVGISTGRDQRAEKRLQGLRGAFASAGIDVLDIRIDSAPSYEAGFDGAAIALARKPRPDVMYFLNDHLAFGGQMACAAAGLAVPEDIGIAGFNGLNINNVLPLPLTTTETPRALMGKTAARMVVAAMRGVRTAPRQTMPVHLQMGATTRPQLTSRAAKD